MPKAEAPATELEFFVDKETCIGCVACAEMFSDIFKMVGDKALAYAKAAAGSVKPTKVIKCCPVDAIKLVAGEMDAGDEALKSLEPVAGWEAEWEKHKNDSEDLLERERRYGRVYQLLREPKGYILRIELPTRVPNHPLVYMYGIETGPPEYEYVVQQVGPDMLSVRAKLTDPKLRFLTGKLNSLPNSFKVDFRFPEPVGAVYRRMYEKGIEIYAFKEGVVDTDVQLRAAMLKQVA
jgi:ferredoxin